MGYSFKGVCHTTVEPAQAAFCESLTTSGLNSQGALVVASCMAVEPPYAKVKIVNGGVASIVQLDIPQFLPCNHDGGINLSLEYFVIGLGLLAVIAASKQVLNIFRGRTDVA